MKPKPMDSAPLIESFEVLVYDGVWSIATYLRGGIWLSSNGDYVKPSHWLPMPKDPE